MRTENETISIKFAMDAMRKKIYEYKAGNIDYIRKTTLSDEQKEIFFALNKTVDHLMDILDLCFPMPTLVYVAVVVASLIDSILTGARAVRDLAISIPFPKQSKEQSDRMINDMIAAGIPESEIQAMRDYMKEHNLTSSSQDDSINGKGLEILAEFEKMGKTKLH